MGCLKPLLAMLVVLMTGSFANADFTSTYDPSLLVPGSITSGGVPSDINYGRRYASPFTLSQTHTAGSTSLSLTYWGGVRLGGERSLPPGGFTMPDPLQFRFRLYTMAGTGEPETLIWDQFSTVASSQEIYREDIQDGGRWFTKSFHEYNVFLSGLPQLDAGTTYFLEVADRDPATSGTGISENAWLWLSSFNSYVEYHRSAPGVDMQSWITSPSGPSRAFAFGVEAVPEPGSMMLALFGLGGFSVTRRARKLALTKK